MVSFYFVISRQERRSNMTTKNNPAMKSVEHGCVLRRVRGLLES